MAAREMTSQLPDVRRRFAQQMADYQQRVAERVTRAREAVGYDLEPFALMAGISPKQLARIEKGESYPRRATLRKIADAANVELSYLQPDLDAEENVIAERLDEINEKLDEILRRLPPAEADEPPETGPTVPDRLPDDPDDEHGGSAQAS